MNQASNGIEVEGLVRQFKNGPRAVDGINLEVQPGEIYGFLGPNGAGKSTTVHMLTTLLPPTAGSARVAGLDVAKQGAEVRKVIGAALQEAALDPHLTGREHMKLQTSLHGLPKDERVKRGDELIERVGLSDAADRRVGVARFTRNFGKEQAMSAGLKLSRGAVVELDRKVGEAIDIYVNNRLVARGEVVVVEDRLGITMTEIVKSEQS